MDNDAINWLLLFVLVLPNLLFFAYWFYKMRIEILKIIYNLKRPWLFKIVTCGIEKYETFEEKYLLKTENTEHSLPANDRE